MLKFQKKDQEVEATAEVKDEAIVKMKVLKGNSRALEIREEVMIKVNAEALSAILITKTKIVMDLLPEDQILVQNQLMAQKVINQVDLVVGQELKYFINFLTN